MTRAIAPVAALLASAAILLMGNGLQGTLLPVRAQLEAFSAVSIGVLGSAYFLGFALGCVLGPFAVRRVGHIRAFTAMVSIASTTALAHALFLEPLVWWALRLVTGFCFAALYMIIESWLNEKATNENRGQIFSVYTIINLTVITAGQMMLILYSPAAFPLFALTSILVSLAAVPVALTTAPAPAPLASVRIRPTHLYRLSPVGFVGALAVGLANGSFWSLGPLFAQSKELTTTGIALFMSIAVIAGAAGQWPLGHLSDRWDRRHAILIACAGAGVGALGMTLVVPFWSHGLFLFCALFGAFAFPVYALAAAHINDYVEADGFVEASSGLLLLYAAGAVIGPVVASALIRAIGPVGLFVFTAGVHVAMAGFTVYRMGRRAEPAEEERARFVDSLIVAQTVSTVDPLSPEAHEAHRRPAAEPSQPAQAAEQPNLERTDDEQ